MIIKYSDFSKTTIKKIIKVLDNIKEKVDLNNYKEDEDFDDNFYYPLVLRVEIKPSKIGTSLKDLYAILHILLKEKVIFGHEISKDKQKNVSIDLLPNFNKKYKIYRKKILPFSLERKNGEKTRQDKEKNGESTKHVIEHKISFNSQTGVLRYGDITHSFHRGSSGQKEKLNLFRKLWDRKACYKKGILTIKGEAFPPESLAIQINLSTDALEFYRNKRIREKFWGLIKSIDRMLREKKIPAKIIRKGGVQLTEYQK